MSLRAGTDPCTPVATRVPGSIWRSAPIEWQLFTRRLPVYSVAAWNVRTAEQARPGDPRDKGMHNFDSEGKGHSSAGSTVSSS